MTTRTLPQQSESRQRPALPLLGALRLPLARVHEGCGNARRSFGAILAGATTGPVMWVQPSWLSERINPAELVRFADPGRFLFVFVHHPEDLLWCTEEALRSGAMPLVVTDLSQAPGLTPIRRLHLAAEAGAEAAATRGQPAPLGLLLTPDDGGAQGIESRWRLTFDHATAPGWRLTRLRARALPPRDWRIEDREDGLHLAA